MYFKLRLVPTAVATLLVAACGGGGGGGTGSVASSPVSGVLVDGYLNFAKVVCDVNENGAYDLGEPVTFTSNTGDGKFTFNPGCTHSILGGVDGTGTNADTSLPFVGLLRSPPGASVITPLTTLLAAGMTAAQITTALNLPAGTNLLTVDPAATNIDGSLKDPELLKKTLAVQQLLQKTTEVVNSLAGMTGSVAVAAVYTQVANALADTLKTGTPLIDANGDMTSGVVSSMVTAAVTKIASASSVDAAIKTALVDAGGTATLPTVMATALTTQAQALLDTSDTTITETTLDRQSNTSIADTLTAAVDAGTLSATTTPENLTSLATTTTTEAIKATPVAGNEVPATPAGSTVLLSFDEANPAFADMGAYGGALPTVESPVNSNAGSALKIVKPSGTNEWGGIYFTTGQAIPFTSTRKNITAAVYSTRANSVIKFKVETTGGAVEVAGTPTGAANTWSTVTWSFDGVDTTKAYNVVAITPDATVAPSGVVYYLDNIALAPASGTAVPPKSGVLATFDETTAPTFAGFGGAEGSSIATAPNGGDGKALNVLRTGGQVYAGATVTVGAMDVSNTNTTITARVYSPLAGIPMVLKLEGANESVTTGDIQATETVVVGWQTLSWVVPSAKISTAYTKVVLLPHLGTLASVSPGESFFYDDITLGAALPVGPVPATDYLYLPNNAIGFSADGTAAAVSYSMEAFQSSGINIKWPMANGAALKFNLAENGTFNLASGQTLSAAVQIEDTVTSGQIRAYTDGVTVSKSGTSITLNVPNLPQALIYGVSGDGNTQAVINFASKVQGIRNVLSTAANTVSTVMFGEVVNYGITGLSNQFTNMSALRGKYKVTIVVNQLPLRKADGTAFDTLTIQMPTSVMGGTASNIQPVTGAGLVGYINLTD